MTARGVIRGGPSVLRPSVLRWGVLRLCGALLALGAAVPAMPAVAQGIPLGTYLASCREVTLSGRALTAVCAAAGGVWVAARLEDYPFCVGDISNRNGTLFCMRALTVLGIQTPAARAAARLPPAGSYMGSCRDIRLEDGWLKATCPDHAGRAVEAGIVANWCANFGRDIANLDGQLACR
ncbi:CVNH domain-containing protein [Xanthobacter sp. V4C-4]|uniref:CVNH domain-containing protein n=1 Tax=Xanthobacter cornucopiae TaxID=3119924 RepID=UPI00372874B5